MKKIWHIKEKPPKPIKLPDGTYMGTWGSFIITINHNGKDYECVTDEGIVGSGHEVVVTIKDGEATFEEVKN